LFRNRLEEIINMSHPLVKLAHLTGSRSPPERTMKATLSDDDRARMIAEAREKNRRDTEMPKRLCYFSDMATF